MRTRTGPGWRRRVAAVAAMLTALPTSATLVTLAATAKPAHATPAATPEQTASMKAKQTGKPVSVDADTTAYTDTMANPDGSYTWSSHQQPQRARMNGAWVAPDATLKLNKDGTVAPLATVAGLTLSGGGNAPLAVMDDGAGHKLSMTLPMPLPKPTVSGDTATYTGVLAGVDLVVTATVDGGFSNVLVVRDATAAVNPALANLRLATTTSGVDLTTDPATGAVTANDTKTGKPVFSAPPPLAWDSTAPSTTQQQDLDQARHNPHVDPSDLPPTTSSPKRPGLGAHLDHIGMKTEPGAITLTPPATVLHGPDVTFPEYIDPGWSVSTYQNDGYVQSWHPTTVGYNPGDNLRTGFDDWTTNCGSPCYQNGITRSYLSFNGTNALWGKHISSAYIQLYEQSASCPNSAQTLQANTAAAFGSNLSWSNQPGWDPNSQTYSTGVSGPNGYQLHVEGMIASAQAGWWTYLDVVLHMSTESDDCGYRHWYLDSQRAPALVVTYWSTPDTPQIVGQVNGGQTIPCNSTSPGTWISKATNDQIGLRSTISTASTDVGYYLNASTYVVTNGGTQVPYYDSTSSYPGGPYTVTRTINVADGSGYGWSVQADNNVVWGPFSVACYFRYDANPPTAPTGFSSTAYPKNGPTTVATGGSGSISWSGASDTSINPGGLASGVASYDYNVNGTAIDSGGAGLQTTTGTSVSIPLSSLHWGTNTLWVRSRDTAGNVSQTASYSFYVQQSAFGAYTPGTAGDIDADSNPDLVTVDAAGNLRLFTHPDTVSVKPTGNTTADPLQYGGRILIPHNQDTLWPGGTFAGALVTHAGSFTGHNADDLIIEQTHTESFTGPDGNFVMSTIGNLAVAQNVNGNATTWTITNNIAKPACPTCTNYNNTDWSSVMQMIAVPSAAPGGRPSLLTIEYVNGTANLWLYPPLSAGTGFAAPTLISGYGNGWSWDTQDLLGAGPLPGTTGTTLWVRDAGPGKVRILHNIEAGLPDPTGSAVTVASGYDAVSHPMVTTVGRADPNGNLPLWGTDANGQLDVTVSSTNSSGVTTLGTTQQVSDPGWAGHEQALQSNYTPYNNDGIAFDGFTGAADGTFDNGTNSYSVAAWEAAALGDGVATACPPARTTTCPTGLSSAGGVYVPQANGAYTFALPFPEAHRRDNYNAAGQVIPAPFDANEAPARYITFLGAANNTGSAGSSGTATITYTNGHTQQVSITLSDWTLGDDSWSPAAGNITVATCAYRDRVLDGTEDQHNTYLYATTEAQLLDNGQPLAAGVQIASITLPNNSTIHIFSAAVN